MSKIKGFAAVLAAVAMVFVGNSAHADAPQLGWTAVQMTADPSCIRNDGTTVYAYAAGAYEVNGVQFAQVTGDAFPNNANVTWDGGYCWSNKTKTIDGVSDEGYAGLLSKHWQRQCYQNGAAGPKGSMIITLNNLTVDKKYLVQIIGCGNWYDTSVYVEESGEAVSSAILTGGDWTYGGSLIGVFTATGTSKEIVLKYTDIDADYTSWNAIQVRELPSSSPIVRPEDEIVAGYTAAQIDAMGQFDLMPSNAVFAGTSFNLPYRQHTPTVADGVKYPLVIFLHGVGERGNNTGSQAKDCQPICRYAMKHGDAYVIAPQCPDGVLYANTWAGVDWNVCPMTRNTDPTPQLLAVKELIEAMLDDTENYAIDPTRVYITGVSMGAFGTWDLVSRMSEGTVTAIMPCCGGADTSLAAAYDGIAIRFFHGAIDNVVTPQFSRLMDVALTTAGVEHDYIEYAGVGHTDCYNTNHGYSDRNLAWLFGQIPGIPYEEPPLADPTVGTWTSSALSATGADEISTEGDLVWAFCKSDSGDNATYTQDCTVNGVVFKGTWAPKTGYTIGEGGVAVTDCFEPSPALTGAGDTSDEGLGSDSHSYPNLIKRRWAGGSLSGTDSKAVFTFKGLEIGCEYLVQLFIHDGGCDKVKYIVAPDGTTKAYYGNYSTEITDCKYGSVLTGRFKASGTTQSFTFTYSDPGSYQLNAVQLRKVGSMSGWVAVPTAGDGSTVVTTGAVKYAYAYKNGVTINGVAFTGSDSLTSENIEVSPGFDANYTDFHSKDAFGSGIPGDPTSSDVKTLIRDARYNNSGSQYMTVTFKGLEQGKTYLAQLFVCDNRVLENGTRICGLKKLIAPEEDGSYGPTAAHFGATDASDMTWAFGGSLVGVFEATGTAYQVKFNCDPNNACQLNAVQVRELGVATVYGTPTIETASVAVNGSTATFTLSGVDMGDNAQSYGIYLAYATHGGTLPEASEVALVQTAAEVTYDLTNLADGTYDYSIYVKNNGNVDSVAKTGSFTVAAGGDDPEVDPEDIENPTSALVNHFTFNLDSKRYYDCIAKRDAVMVTEEGVEATDVDTSVPSDVTGYDKAVAIPQSYGLKVAHSIPTDSLSSYCLVMRFYSPTDSDSQWRSFYRTTTDNSDAALFIKNDNTIGAGGAWGGYGESKVSSGAWHSLIVSVDADAGTRAVYYDGVQELSSDTVSDKQENLTGKSYIFFSVDNNDEDYTLYFDDIRIYNVAKPKAVFDGDSVRAGGPDDTIDEEGPDEPGFVEGWTAEKMTADGKSIRTDGELVYAFSAANTGNANLITTQTINTVEFQGINQLGAPAKAYGDLRASDCIGANVSMNTTYNFCNSDCVHEISDTVYADFLKCGFLGSDTASITFSLKQLEEGGWYLVQFIVHDGRNSCKTRQMAAPGGTAVITYGGTDWPCGGSLVGVFQADGETQDFTFTYPQNNKGCQLQAVQVRKLSEPPAPPSTETWTAIPMSADLHEFVTDGTVVWAKAAPSGDPGFAHVANGIDFMESQISDLASVVTIDPAFSDTKDKCGWEGLGADKDKAGTFMGRAWVCENASNDGVMTMTVGNLTIGHRYCLQLMIHNDGDSQGGFNPGLATDTMTAPDGTATITYGGTGWQYGGTLIGTFVADAATKSFTFTHSRASYFQVNAIQLRDIDAVEEAPVYTLTIPEKEGLTLVSVETNGVPVAGVGGAYSIVSNTEVTVTFAPPTGYEFTGSASVVLTVEADTEFPDAQYPLTREPQHLALYVSPTAVTGVGDGSYANPYTMSEAWSKVKSNETIQLLDGTYIEETARGDSAAFTVRDKDNVTFQGNVEHPEKVIIDFNGSNIRGFYSPNMQFTIRGITFQNKLTSSESPGVIADGGETPTGPAIVENCRFLNIKTTVTSSTSNGRMGTVFRCGMKTDFIVRNCVFDDVDCYVWGVMYVTAGTLSLSNCTVNSCYTQSHVGSVVGLNGGTSLTIEDSDFVNIGSKLDFTGDHYSGVIHVNSGTTAPVTIRRSRFWNDSSHGVRRGGFAQVNNGQTMTFEDCEFYDFKVGAGWGGLFYVPNGNAATIEMSGCVVSNASCQTNGGTFGIDGDGTKIVLNDCQFQDCKTTHASSGYGGLIYVSKDKANVSIAMTNCVCTGMSAARGGVICLGTGSDTIGNGCSLSVCDCSFDACVASDTMGGAVFMRAPKSFTASIAGSAFTGCTAKGGGGALYAEQGDFALVDCAFTNSLVTSSTGNGGAISSKGALAVTNCVFVGNSVSGSNGGAIYANGSYLSAFGCCFATNTAYNGGAVIAAQSATTTNEVVNCKFIGNVGTNAGPGVFSYQNGGYLTVRNCLFADNVVGKSSGSCAIHATAGGTRSVENCTFVNNSASATSVNANRPIYFSSSSPTVSNCVFYGNRFANNNVMAPGDGTYGHCAAETGLTVTDENGNLTLSVSPFVDAENGDYTLVPLIGYDKNPCIDGGAGLGWTADEDAVDITGAVRVFGSAPDIGAYEYGAIVRTRLVLADAEAVPSADSAELSVVLASLGSRPETAEVATYADVSLAWGIAQDQLCAPVAISNNAVKGDVCSWTIPGLAAETVYYYQFSAVNDLGAVTNLTGSFTTLTPVYTLTIPEKEGLTLVSVETNGVPVAGVGGAYSIVSNTEVTVTFAVASGYELDGDSLVITKTIDSDYNFDVADYPSVKKQGGDEPSDIEQAAKELCLGCWLAVPLTGDPEEDIITVGTLVTISGKKVSGAKMVVGTDSYFNGVAFGGSWKGDGGMTSSPEVSKTKADVSDCGIEGAYGDLLKKAWDADNGATSAEHQVFNFEGLDPAKTYLVQYVLHGSSLADYSVTATDVFGPKTIQAYADAATDQWYYGGTLVHVFKPAADGTYSLTLDYRNSKGEPSDAFVNAFQLREVADHLLPSVGVWTARAADYAGQNFTADGALVFSFIVDRSDAGTTCQNLACNVPFNLLYSLTDTVTAHHHNAWENRDYSINGVYGDGRQPADFISVSPALTRNSGYGHEADVPTLEDYSWEDCFGHILDTGFAGTANEDGTLDVTFKGLTPGHRYIAEIFVHRENANTKSVTAPDGKVAYFGGTVVETDDWKHGGILTGTFAATNVNHNFTFTYSDRTDCHINAIQLRDLDARTDPNGTWIAVQNTASDLSVITDGKLKYAYANGAYTVNGVAFAANSMLSAATDNIEVAPGYGYDKADWEDCSVSGDYGKVLKSGWLNTSDTPADSTITLKNLQPGKTYKVQLVVHNGNNPPISSRKMIAPDGVATVQYGNDNKSDAEDWYYGGSLIGTFVATGAVHQFTFTYSSSATSWKCLNAIQLRALDEVEIVNPAIGSVETESLGAGTSVKFTLSEVVIGTDAMGVPGSSYSVWAKLDDGTAEEVVKDASGETATFTLTDLAAGDHVCTVYIENDLGATSDEEEVEFTVTPGYATGWYAEPMDDDGLVIRDDGLLLYSYMRGNAKSVFTVNNVPFTGLSNVNLSDSYDSLSLKFNYGSGFYRDMATVTSTDPYDLMLGYDWRAGGSGDRTLKLTGLESGKKYLVQLVLHDTEYTDGAKTYAPASDTVFAQASGDGWTKGGTLVGIFVATNSVHEFTLNSSTRAVLNAIQVRQVEDIDPVIGNVLVGVDGRDVIVSLRDILLGTDALVSPATKYDVWLKKGNGAAQRVLTDQTATAVNTFRIENLAEGVYDYSVFITTDQDKTSVPISVPFTIGVNLGWIGEAMTSGGETVRTDGDLVYAYAFGNSSLTVNGVEFDTLGTSNFRSNDDIAFGSDIYVIGMGAGKQGSAELPADVDPESDYCKLLKYGFHNGVKSIDLTLKNLDPEKTYMVQIFSHATISNPGEEVQTEFRNSYMTAPGDTSIKSYCWTDDWDHGGSLIGIFKPDGETQTFTLPTSGRFVFNGLQVREVAKTGEWIGEQLTADETVVQTDGTLVWAFCKNAAGVGATTYATANGVKFEGIYNPYMWETTVITDHNGKPITDYFTLSPVLTGQADQDWEGLAHDDEGYANLIYRGWQGTAGENGAVTLTLKGLEVGHPYEVQLFAHLAHGNEHAKTTFTSPDSKVSIKVGDDAGGDNALGGTLIGKFIADATEQSFILTYDDPAGMCLNAIQLRDLTPVPPTMDDTVDVDVDADDATFTLTGISLGTDGNGVHATSYDVYCLRDGAISGAPIATGLTGDTAEVTAHGFYDGHHVCQLYIVTDVGTSTEPVEVEFDVDESGLGIWIARPMDSTGAAFVDEGDPIFMLCKGAHGTGQTSTITISDYVAFTGLGRFYDETVTVDGKLPTAYLDMSPQLKNEHDDGTDLGDVSGTYGQLVKRSVLNMSDDATGQLTVTLKGLEVGEEYVVQLMMHHTDKYNYTVTAPDTVAVAHAGRDPASGSDEWKYGGSLIGRFTAKAETQDFTFYYDKGGETTVNNSLQRLNAIQLRRTSNLAKIASAAFEGNREKGTITVSGIEFGYDTTECDVYLAYAPKVSAMPAAVKVNAEPVTTDSYAIKLTGLDYPEEYDFRVFISNTADHVSRPVTGSFTTVNDFGFDVTLDHPDGGTSATVNVSGVNIGDGAAYADILFLRGARDGRQLSTNLIGHITSEAELKACSYELTGLTEGADYRWAVVATNDIGLATEPEFQSFHVNDTSSPTQLTDTSDVTNIVSGWVWTPMTRNASLIVHEGELRYSYVKCDGGEELISQHSMNGVGFTGVYSFNKQLDDSYNVADDIIMTPAFSGGIDGCGTAGLEATDVHYLPGTLQRGFAGTANSDGKASVTLRNLTPGEHYIVQLIFHNDADGVIKSLGSIGHPGNLAATTVTAPNGAQVQYGGAVTGGNGTDGYTYDQNDPWLYGGTLVGVFTASDPEQTFDLGFSVPANYQLNGVQVRRVYGPGETPPTPEKDTTHGTWIGKPMGFDPTTLDAVGFVTAGEPVWAFCKSAAAENIEGRDEDGQTPSGITGIDFHRVQGIRFTGIYSPTTTRTLDGTVGGPLASDYFEFDTPLVGKSDKYGAEDVTTAEYPELNAHAYQSLLTRGWEGTATVCPETDPAYGTTTLTLHQLEPGQAYVVQLTYHFHNLRNNYVTAPDKVTKAYYGDNPDPTTGVYPEDGWRYGGTLIGTFTATKEDEEFTFKYGAPGYCQVNSIQLRKAENASMTGTLFMIR